MPRKITGKRSTSGEYAPAGNIRWRKRDLEKIERTITNFNKRLYRQQKKNDGSVILPERRSKTQAVKGIKTRADFNRFIKDLESFTAKSAQPVTIKDGTTFTQWQVDKAQREDAAYQKKKEAFGDYLDNQTIKKGGEDTGNIKKYAFISDKEFTRAKDPRSVLEMNKEEALRFFDLAESRMRSTYNYEKQVAMMHNYIRGLTRMGFSDELIDMISHVPPDKFLEIVETDVFAEFDWIYDPTELAAKEEQIYNAFSAYASDEEFISYYDIESIQSDVAEKLANGYFGRHYDNEHRRYRRKNRRK